ncbi:hypothetical protein LPJ77_002716, partial [Coemansia sp. RSA 2523]
MEKCLKQWPNVIELNLCFGFNYFSRLRADRNINRYQASMQPYVKTIGELLPRVSKLVLQGATQCEVLDEWFGDLALHYSNQLRYLDCDYCVVIDTPPLQTFNMLTNLNVTFDKTLTLKPEDLETLTITHLQIGMVMDSAMVIAFITKLSRLVDIKFTNVSMEDSVLNLAGPAINGDIGKTVVPFAAPINSLSRVCRLQQQQQPTEATTAPPLTQIKTFPADKAGGSTSRKKPTNQNT